MISLNTHAGYEHVRLNENDSLEVGEAVGKSLETPGYMPDSRVSRNMRDTALILTFAPVWAKRLRNSCRAAMKCRRR